MDTPAVGTAAPPVARYLLASLFLILLLASVARSLPTTVERLVHLGQGDARLTAADRQNMWASGLEISPDELAFYRAALGPADRFYVETPLHPGDADLRSRVLEATSFALLPNVMVPSARQATVVLAFDSDPARLHLRYGSVQRDGRLAVARIDRGR